MKTEKINIKNTTNNTLHQVIKCCLEGTDYQYNTILQEAKKLMEDVDDHAPDGHVRSEEEKLVKCFGGLVAEFFVLKEINNLFKENGFNHIVAKKTIYDKKKDIDQIDIMVENTENGKSKTIEVRSSYILKSKDIPVYNTDASLVGYYVTRNKLKEFKKDYYITVLFRNIWIKLNEEVEKEIEDENFNTKIIKYMQERINKKNNIVLHVSAAASLDFLEINGIESSLENRGARYKIIKPIINAKSLSDIIKDIHDKLK